MEEYEFTLRFALPSPGFVSDQLIEQLGRAGCEDALVGVGQAGRVALDFARGSGSARQAIVSAIQDVRRAIPGAELLEVTPDLVGLTDIAGIMGCSRQNMRKLLMAASPGMPAPVHEGTPSLWHLAPVLNWLARKKHYQVESAVLELAEATMAVNAALCALQIDDDRRVEIQALLA